MDLVRVQACADRILARLDVLLPANAGDEVATAPLLRAAIDAASDELAAADDLESRTVAQATVDALTRTYRSRKIFLLTPTLNVAEAANLLNSCVAGQGPDRMADGPV